MCATVAMLSKYRELSTDLRTASPVESFPRTSACACARLLSECALVSDIDGMIDSPTVTRCAGVERRLDAVAHGARRAQGRRLAQVCERCKVCEQSEAHRLHAFGKYAVADWILVVLHV